MRGDAPATVNNIAAHELLFRLGIVAELLGAVILIFLVLAFYRLFKDVGQYLAVLVVIFGGVMPGLINFVNVVSDAGALMIVRGDGFLSVFDKPQRDPLVMLLLRLHDHQNTAADQNRAFIIFQPALLGEIVLMLWLVIKGARPPAPDSAASWSAAR